MEQCPNLPMWNVKYKNSKTNLSIPADDVVFTAILYRGLTNHTKKGSFVSAYHLPSDDEGKQLEFKMSILEASAICSRYEDFENEGLMGRWKLISPTNDSSEPAICLIKPIIDPKSFLIEASAPENPEWVRSFYSTYCP